MKCLNIIVFYNNKQEVFDYITEVKNISDDIVDIIVVVNSDNKSEVDTMISDLESNHITGVEIINYGNNVGYLNSLLKTIKKVNIAEYDYFILSNTDIHYADCDFFYKLTSYKYSNKIGCIAPSVYSTRSKSYSNPHYMERIPEQKIKRLIKIFKYPLLGKLYLSLANIKAFNTKTEKKASCYVYSPHGCYMIFRNRFIKELLNYEYGVNLYSEESAIGELLIQKGYLCYYDSSINVIHQESAVTGKINYKRRFSAWRESLIYILKEFY